MKKTIKSFEFLKKRSFKTFFTKNSRVLLLNNTSFFAQKTVVFYCMFFTFDPPDPKSRSLDPPPKKKFPIEAPEKV